nr:EOG090X07BN [Macrothrix elegans]
MAPKKKSVRAENSSQPSTSTPLLENNSENGSVEFTSCKNHKLNGHINPEKQVSNDLTVHVNGCNGTHSSDSSESSNFNVPSSSPEESIKTEQTLNVEVVSASLDQLSIDVSKRVDHTEKSESLVTVKPSSILAEKITYVQYQSELQMPDIMRLIQKDLSEPYSIYTYRYFIHNWPMLCFLAMYEEKCVGAIVCKLDLHKKVVRRGYIAMLAVDENYRQGKIGSNLVMKAIAAMVADGADEVVLETEITNEPALRLYENLGFVRDKRLFRYYLNGVDALRLKLWLR